MASVKQNIQYFYDQAQTKDFSRDFLFRVRDIRLAGGIDFNDNQLVYAKAAQLPGRTIKNVAVPYMGLNLNVPGGVEYSGSEAYNITFYADADGDLRRIFESASRTLFNEDDSTGAYGTPSEEFYIELSELNKDLNPISTYKLVGASLREIQGIDYKIAEGTGETVELTTTIAYHYYKKTQ